jgi:hypothetical protein
VLSTVNGSAIPLNSGNTAWEDGFLTTNYLIESYNMAGTLSHDPAGAVSLVTGDSSITYRFGGNGEDITSGAVYFNGWDGASSDGSWLLIDISDLSGTLVYRLNLTGLNGNVGTSHWEGWIDFATASPSFAPNPLSNLICTISREDDSILVLAFF